MSELPLGWVSVPIGDLCSLKNGRAFKASEWAIAGLPIVRIQNLNNPAAPFNYFSGEAEERYQLTGRELLFAWSGTPGTSFGAHVWHGGKAVLNQHIFRVDFDASKIDKRFFRYAINQKLDELIDIAHGGVGLRHVTKGTFERTKVAIPPLREQKRIADKLDVLLARVDAGRARLDRIPELLKRFRQSVLAAAISGDLTEDWRKGKSAAWASTNVQSIAKVGTGSTPLRSNAKFFSARGTPWITSAATSQRIVTEANEHVTEDAIKAHRLKTYPVGTILVAMYGEGKTRGQVTELGIPATVNQACAAVIVDEAKADRLYVRRALESNYYEMRDLAEGGNQPNLNLNKIKEFSLPLPSLSEQREIAYRVESLFAIADKVQAQYEAARAQVDKLTPALLAKAFRGELIQQGRTDESAEQPLARTGVDLNITTSLKQKRGSKTQVRKQPKAKRA
ncbi:restriction endonuclease subunit S [Dyella flava]|uniref:Restriction endonuclease subunit S n=1 Tax=Dyella flava TaxID=1920170 RepID=A0ABS2JZI7_9GAMM|nr:restriction endonuclease subunit S [Dyella flava]MBM7124416.1 restriction endonuclease subunit S [Dyella flava]GLQ52505.1 hypothetical protein GCM10010872_39540 [Dyella flava]